MERVILHCDCNSFFASVETVLNPSYSNVPMAVCGSVKDRHGIVLAKNELAKACGIKTAETVYSARKKCPSLVIASPHYEEYSEFSRRVNKIYSDYTDLIEPFGIDESWLDITASLRFFGSKEAIAEQIRRRVREEIGITVSIGVSFNKVFAKLGSDYRKPDAITYISRDNFKSIVFPLPVGDLLFVGKHTEEELRNIGISTIGELAASRPEILRLKFGKMGDMLHIYSNGLDDSPVSPEKRKDPKSISNGLTFKHDITKSADWRTGIDYLSEELGSKLRAQSLLCNGVSVTVKDNYLRSIQRQRQLECPTDISKEIAEAAYNILVSSWPGEKPIRMITVSVHGLMRASSLVEQFDLFSDNDTDNRAKYKKREETVDIIRQKYGASSILRGAVLSTDIASFTDTDEE